MKVRMRPREESIFRAATLSVHALLTLFLVGILAALAAHTRWDTFLTTLLSEEILFSIKLTVATATISTLLSMAVAIPAGYALSQSRFPGKDLVDTILDLPIVVSPIALGAALLVFFNTPLGAGIENRLIRVVFEVPGIVLAQFTVVHALAVRLLKSTFDAIDPRYEQVGRTLGYGRTAVFFKVTLPMARQGLIAACILTWARAIGEFGATVMLAGATKMKTETLPIAIFLNLSTASIEKAIAVVFILVALAAGALVLLRKVAGGRRLP